MKIVEKKRVRQNGEVVNQFYYSYKEIISGKTILRLCRNCNTREEAEAYAENVVFKNDYLVKRVAARMYLPGSEHLKRLESFGKKIDQKTIKQKRQITELIIKDFGNSDLTTLQVKDIESFLLNDDQHSGSWKNFYLETFGNIYEETIWRCPSAVPKPKFQRFARNSRKPDVFTKEELDKLFDDCTIWKNYMEYLFFLTTFSCGLRIGETRGLKVGQLLLDDRILVINGFCKDNGRRTVYNKKGSENDLKIRATPIPMETAKLLERYIRINQLKDEDYVFFKEDPKTPLRREYMDREFKRALLKADIDISSRKLIPHSLRFTYITRMRRVESKENIREIVGHSSIEMTDYYTRASLPDIINSAKKTLPKSDSLFE